MSLKMLQLCFKVDDPRAVVVWSQLFSVLHYCFSAVRFEPFCEFLHSLVKLFICENLD